MPNDSFSHYVKRTVYSPRWQFLRPFLGLMLNAGPEGQWLRVVMHRELDKAVAALEPRKRVALEISGNRWSDMGIFQSCRTIEYPAFDICRDVLKDRFDMIIAEQVFEHLLWPYRAARNVYSMLNPGGVFLVSTPFLVRLHQHPYDCSRWSELGLRNLLVESGFDEGKITTASWGNRECLRANLLRWQTYVPGWHTLRNEPEFPLMVWALAEK